MKPDPTRQRIALFGNFGIGNLGNEATLHAMVYNLRRHLPDVQISCICSGPEKTALAYNIPAAPIRPRFPIWKASNKLSSDNKAREWSNGQTYHTTMEPDRWLQAFARLRALLRTFAFPLLEGYRWLKGITSLKEHDLLIMTGTGMLGDYALHYEIFRWAVIAKLRRCKLLFVSVGGGPIRHPLSRCFVKAALALADYRSYRDASSKDYLKAVGVDVKNDAVYPDLAFSLPRAVVPVDHDHDQPAFVIGVGLMNYYESGRSGNPDTTCHDYLGRMASFVVGLLEHSYAVRVLIGDFVDDQDVRHDLRRELEERGVNYQNRRIIDEPAASVDELLSQLSSVDLVVSSRFHNLVLAVMLGKPVFAISYHEKFQPLMDGVGLGGFCQDIEQIDVDELIGKVSILREDVPAIKLHIARETERYRVALDEQYERLVGICRSVK
jgi:polysaccharide pyruvyl transferase WcaK-like protein